jgi:hypothetical protein
VDVDIDGRERLVIPGLVNIHSHPSGEPLRKGITDETRSPGFHHSSLYEFLTVFDNDAEGRLASLQVALSELLMSGCTTITDLSTPYEGWLDTLGGSGIRAVVAPGFRDARWLTRDGHTLEYEWDEGAGREAFEVARQTIDRAEQPFLGCIDGQKNIGMPVRWIQQHCHGAGGQPLFYNDRIRIAERYVVEQTFIVEAEGFSCIGTISTVGDELVCNHRATQ